jgi:hypothetical protein
MIRKYVKSVCHISSTRVVGSLNASEADIRMEAGLVMSSAAFKIR